VLRLMTLAGDGITLAATFLVVEELAAGTLVPLLPAHRPVELSINAIYPHRHHLSPKVRRFIDLVAERFAGHRKWLALEGTDQPE
jgi:DNA-binding transcriptional LysR family regulator